MQIDHVRQEATSSHDRSSNDSADRPQHPLLASRFDEKPIWSELIGTLRDTLFPAQLPPLELTSTPIPTPDRISGRTNPWAFGTAAFMNAGLLALLIVLSLRSHVPVFSDPVSSTDASLKDFKLIAPPTLNPARGGGGGNHALIDPITGHLPKLAEIQLAPPQIPLLQNPILKVDSSIIVPLDMKIPDNPNLPNIGVHTSPNVRLISNGQGTRTGIGTGSDGGDGPGHGPGTGPGQDSGYGDSIYRPGIGGVSKPIPVVAPEAEFSDEARRQQYQGVCIVSIIVDAHGNPQNPRVTRPLGMGLDEKALEAVQKYRFKPAMKDGKPVASYVTVQINFRLY